MAASSVFVLLSLCIACFLWGAASFKSVPAVFVFGDSTADVGNNDFLPTVGTAKSNFLPNGIDFPGGIPTGRFSNGFNTIDFLAMKLGFKQSPPAFLSVTSVAQMLQGVNFASGGSGVLNSTGTNILTFTMQLEKFKTVIEAITKRLGKEKAHHLLINSIYLISTGSNDMFNYYSSLGPQNKTTNEQFISTLIGKYEDHLKVLYKYGARKFGVVGISHIGCIPLMRSLNPTGRCTKELNSLARTFNKAAKAQLHHLSSKLDGMRYCYGNAYDSMTLALSNPKMFGYKDVKSACCGSGNFNAATSCTPNATYCTNRNAHLFWDRFHPTQATSSSLAMQIYGGTRKFATPVNLKILAESTSF